MDKKSYENMNSEPPPTYMQSQGGFANPVYGQQYAPAAPVVGVTAQQPAAGYTIQPGQQVVIVQPSPLTSPPPDYMTYAIMVTICCCWPVGIFAILRSSDCRSAIARGDRETALQKSREARTLSHAALFSGLAIMVITFVILGVYFGVLFHNLGGDSD